MNKCQGTVNVVLVVLLVAPCLYRIEKTATNTANQVEALTSEVRALEERIIEQMKDPQKWPRAINQIPAR